MEEKSCPNEYGVYSAVLKQRLANHPSIKQIVIRKITGGGRIASSLVSSQVETALLSNKDLVEAELIENYNADHDKPIELKDKFCVDLPLFLVTDENLKPIFEASKADFTGESAGKAMEKKYGTSRIIKFSRVAFNKSKSVALVHAEVSCPGACGNGDIYFLTKKDGKWTVIMTFNTWIS